MSVQNNNIEDINPSTWFGNRELQFSPKHFVKSAVPVTTSSRVWIVNRLTGRYFFYIRINDYSSLDEFHNDYTLCPAFEDPAEAVLYELTWG